MGNVSCSKIIRAAGCSDLAVIIKGLGRDAGGGDDDEDSDSQAQTFREEMRRRAGLRGLEDSRREEVEMKRHAVLERVRKKPRERKGDPLELLRPEASLHDRVVVAMSTGLEPQDTAFDVKSIHVVGLPSLESIGDEHFASIRSERARLPSWQRPNQDEAFFVELKDGYRVCAVADGHGAEGHRAAAAVRDFLLRRLVASLPATRSSNVDEHRIRIHNMLLKALEDANHALFSGEEAVDARASGATACVVVYDMKKRWLFTSWVGDCRCVVGEYVEEGGALTEGGRRTSIGSEGHSSEGNSSKRRRGRGLNKTTVSGVRLSEDHTLSDANERVRVAQFSATIANGPLGLDEVYLSGHKFPGVHCSRCLGNLVAKQLGITAQPEVFNFRAGLGQELHKTSGSLNGLALANIVKAHRMPSHGLRLASCLALCLPLWVATDSDSLYILGSSESSDSERISTDKEIDKFLSMFLAPESTTSLVLTVYRPWSMYRTHQMKVARALNAYRRAEAPAIAVYVSQSWEPSNDLLREWLQRSVPQIWTGKGSTLMVRVQNGRVSRGTTNAGNAQSCQQALHCLLRTMYEEEEHDLPHGAGDEDCAPTIQTVHDGISWPSGWKCPSSTEL
ncbi:unnamed protein product [Symbiodinium necroappetens]|uniref:PPM-type phosphatase domain-containing protein n=1 Tax=Symbiodinium necroappetens TaxID=1628268 RepID=A0A812Z1S7_9DINO|nr:unnamed protein product [Symbiodinium necroappetens]